MEFPDFPPRIYDIFSDLYSGPQKQKQYVFAKTSMSGYNVKLISLKLYGDS